MIPTPGHSDDHICLYEPNEGWLFSGDLFISEQMKYLREDEDIYSIIDSLKKVAALHPKKMFCSFNGSIDHPMDAIHKKIEYLENLKKECRKRISSGSISPGDSTEAPGERRPDGFYHRRRNLQKKLINAFLRAKRG